MKHVQLTEASILPGYSIGRQPHFVIIYMLRHCAKQAGLEYLYSLLRNINRFSLEQLVEYGQGKFITCEKKTHRLITDSTQTQSLILF